MTITLTLAPELEFKLKQEADRRGLPLEQCALEVLGEHIADSARERAEKLAEMFRQWNEEEVDESEALDDEFFRRLEENRVAFREITSDTEWRCLMTLALAPELEERLKQEADRQGLPLVEYASKVLEEHISQAERERREKAIALVQSWIDEGDEQEQKETGEYLIRVLDEDRLSDRKLFPVELKGVSW